MRQNDSTFFQCYVENHVIRLLADSQRMHILNITSMLPKKLNHLGMDILIRQQLACEQFQLEISAVIIVSLLSDWAAKFNASSTSSVVSCG